MPSFIDRDRVQAIMGEAQVVEVLEADSYRELHLPGAGRNIPLWKLDRRAPVELRDVPIVVYCQDLA